MGEPDATDRSTAREDWRADRPDDDELLGSLWIRWTDGGSDLHLHRICEIVPQVTRRDSFPFLAVSPESGARPTFERVEREPDGTYRETGEEAQFAFIDGVPRQLLRHTPFVILVASALLVGGARIDPSVAPITDLVPTIAGPDAGLFGLYLAITPVLLWLLSMVDVVEYREFPTALAIYGLVGGLLAGVGASVFLTVSAGHPSSVAPNVVFVSGYLLLLLVAGQFLYEATLRIEHLFVTLGTRTNDIVGDELAYRHFLTDLHDNLRLSAYGFSPSRVFGVLVAAQFAIIWLIGNGPQELEYGLGLVVNASLNAVLGTVAFQFLVVVRYFNRLLNANGEYSDVDLTYEPFHVDGYGGFRDLGRFAIRINLLLSMAGLYLVYRLYVVGGRAVPPEGVMAIGDPLATAVWLISFVGPVVGYALGAGAWGYYSFWSMHAKMVRDKHRIARKYQGTHRETDASRTPAAGDRIHSFDDSEGPEWAALQDAPTWPLDVNKMASLLSSNVVPLLFPVSNVLF
ncbi:MULTISPECIES: hypothetical protein [unclassified Halorhabdus]|uniref:hypothetical protein n=1 Tax=unclassified Halorhabdus TaxID=2621901 RepID=UPI0023DA2943|nr:MULTISPECIES: hypothetical protein [unclassified Halorhabdus]WEL17793.1 putative membrane protein [Halorhabdus sp. SVX81]WEL21669.1 putative membrane protein [Halorhabdus sp. BNX81]